MSEWLTPQGILAICAMITTVVLPLVVRVLTLAGAKKDTIEKVATIQAEADSAQKVAASVIGGVNKFKDLATPANVQLLVETLKAHNMTTGSQEAVKRIVDDVATGSSTTDAVRTETTRYRRVS